MRDTWQHRIQRAEHLAADGSASVPLVAFYAALLRVACDTCGHYLKGVDLTRLGVAVPIVDEVAGAPLDAWAREHGYEKIELNLVGL